MIERNGLLIAFEGIDGTGKSTQVNLMKTMLEEMGLKVVIYKEPTNETEAGKKIRASYVEGRVSLEKELAWFIEDRQWNVSTRVLPAITEGKIVFLDRYFFSTACYQGVRKNGDWKTILEMNREKFPEPDLTVIFDLDPEIARKRIMKSRKESNTFEGLDYLVSVRNLFLEIYSTDKNGHYLLIDSSQEIADIASKLFVKIYELVKRQSLVKNSLGF